MLNFADFLVAGFIFLLFVSIYRKRSSSAVRFWVAGWFFVLLHFTALLWHPRAETPQVVQSILALGTLVLCGTAFALSYPTSHNTARREVWTGCLLGGPWLLTMIFAALPAEWTSVAATAAVVSHLCLLLVSARLFRVRSSRFLLSVAMVLGCGTWLVSAVRLRDDDAIVGVVLTLCFGFNAILLSKRGKHLSAANMTTSVGATAWGSVWVCSALLSRYGHGLVVSPEVWNLPKYFVAAGMVLHLLDEEIRTTELTSEQYRVLFAGNPQPMWIYSPETLTFLEVNESAVAHYGYSQDEFQAMSLLDVVHGAAEEDALAVLRADAPQTLSGPWRHRRKDGTEFQVDVASQPVVRGDERAIFALMHDVTEPQRLHAELLKQAHHDALTGLPNRVLFERQMEETLVLAAKGAHKAALFCIDLDRFKQINDTFGHAAGDRCLCELARRVTRRLQGAGTLARTGGDEFMLLMGDLAEAEIAEHLAALLLYDLRTPVTLEGGEVELVASIGIAVFPDDGADGAQLWRDADVAMYRAKRAGGSQWVRVSREISRVASESSDIERHLRRSLKVGGLALCYQPQYTASGELYGVEALVRFPDPQLCHVPPGKVISIAEESGLIVSLGEWVLEEVCRQGREWLDEGLRSLQIAVNVSPLQLNRMNFSLKVASTLERYHLSPRIFEFEVTESTVMPDRGEAPDQIAMLAQMGICFAVDDFGTGYSSLGRLHQLPVDSLKIDGSFISQIANRKGTYPTVRAIIGLAHSFGLKVVAEGVETEEQLRILRTLKCDRMQGFLFSKPVPAHEIRRFLVPATTEDALVETRSAAPQHAQA